MAGEENGASMTLVEKAAMEIAVKTGCLSSAPTDGVSPCGADCYCMTAAKTAYELLGSNISLQMISAGTKAGPGVRAMFVTMLKTAMETN